MRIITGYARGAHLETLESDATRPTSDKVKEAIFSMIQFDLEGRRVLDLFGGSGQLALEALSRGAEKATITDNSRDAVDIIIKNAKHTKTYDKCRISNISFDAFLKRKTDEKYDIIFLDPPYGTEMLHDSLKLIADGDLLAEGAYIICECDTRPSKKNKLEKKDADILYSAVMRDVFGGDENLMKKYLIEKNAVYGRTRVTVLSRTNSET